MPKAAPRPLISDQRLRHLYVTLLACRALRRHQRKRAAGLVASEALVAGTVTHLENDDQLMTANGDPWAALARGHSRRQAVSTRLLPGMMPLIASAPSRFAVAAGYALARRAQDAQTSQIILVFSGPGVATLDPFADALAVAASHKLGILFVVETPAGRDVSGPAYTDKLGLPGIPVDGNDVIALYRVAQEAVTRARRGGGPTLIDCKPWPFSDKADPVRKLEETLAHRGIATSVLKQQAATRAERWTL
jgi:Dehydrogenase E1 component